MAKNGKYNRNDFVEISFIFAIKKDFFVETVIYKKIPMNSLIPVFVLVIIQSSHARDQGIDLITNQNCLLK